MANYKMVDADKLDADLKRVADAIRAKGGYADPMVFPEEFVQEIAAISTGGGGSCDDVRYVTFMNGDVEIGKKAVAVGDDCRYIFDTPTKESTDQYNYTFYGWGAEDGGAADPDILKNVTEDKTVYAIFTATARMYTITFFDDDGVTVLATKQVAYGTVPSYTPTKEGEVFSSWVPTPVAVTGDASYTAVWTSVAASGKFNTNVLWRVYTDNTLEVYGTGAMPDWTSATYGTTSYTNSPIYPYISTAKKIVIADGITYIGKATFYKFTSVRNIVIADSVTSCGQQAFQGCTSLVSITFGIGLTVLSSQMFDGCTSIVNFTIPSGITNIGSSAFAGCSNLISISVPNTVVEIGGSAFARCSKLDNIIIPSSVMTIGQSAFSNCSKLTSITIPDSVTSIGSSAFSYCSKLTSIAIPSGITNIGSGAFAGCSSLISAIFENTSGWTAGAEAISESDLANPSTAAEYLVTTHAYREWVRN